MQRTRAILQRGRILCFSHIPALRGDLLLAPCLCQKSRGAKVLGSDVKEGNVIERKGRIMEVVKTQHTQQGRGGATIQVELRDVQSGFKSTERFRTTEAIERVFCEAKSYTYLYTEGNTVFLMEPNTYDQIEVPKNMFGSGASYLTDGMAVNVQFADGRPLSAAVPPRVTCKVVQTEPAYKGQSATCVLKKVVLENGLSIGAPIFVQVDDMLVVDTTNNTYVTRAKD